MGADTPTTGSGAASESGASGRAPRTKAAGTVVPMCPLRPEDYCSQCQAYATGPQDCGLVATRAPTAALGVGAAEEPPPQIAPQHHWVVIRRNQDCR